MEAGDQAQDKCPGGGDSLLMSKQANGMQTTWGLVTGCAKAWVRLTVKAAFAQAMRNEALLKDGFRITLLNLLKG